MENLRVHIYVETSNIKHDKSLSEALMSDNKNDNASDYEEVGWCPIYQYQLRC